MHYVITGGAGHISKPIAEALLKAGHQVTIVSRSEGNIASLTAAGARGAIGSVEDAAFLQSAFAGADAVYLMIPPNFAVSDWGTYQRAVADNYVSAVEANGIRKVVVLSSIGADLRQGAGPIDALGYLEEKLEAISNLDAVFLRPSYFMYNLFNMIPLIKQAGIMGSNFGASDEKLALVHTRDIAAAATEALSKLEFSGKTVQYIAGEEVHPSAIAAAIGAAIGKPDLPWVPFSDEQTLQGMLGAGLQETHAKGYTEMGAAIGSGKIQAHYYANKPANAPTKLKDFIPEFLQAYNS